MRALRFSAAFVVVIALWVSVLGVQGCASFGQSDPALVRAEDLLVNSLQVYEVTMRFHYASGATKSPAAHEALETIRVKFPKAWRALWEATDAYKHGKGGDFAAAMADVQALIREMVALVGGA